MEYDLREPGQCYFPMTFTNLLNGSDLTKKLLHLLHENHIAKISTSIISDK